MRRSICIYALLALIFSISLIALGASGLTESSEGRYAEISREMILNNDFIHPKLLEIQHFHKPPLTYYITALGYKIFGINEFAARFFLQLALILQIFLVFKTGFLLFRNKSIALISSVIYFSFPVLLISTNNLTTDAYLTTFVLSSIYFWLHHKIRENYTGLYLASLFLGLGFLTKGPVVLLPFVIFVLSYHYFFKQRFKISLHHLLSIIIFILISFSWFAILINENPILWDYFFKTQTVERALNTSDFHRDKPFWYYLVFAPLIGLPWFLFFLIFIVKKRIKELQKDPIIYMLLFNILILFLSFSLFSSKLILYILPIYSYVALITGYFLDTAKTGILKTFINSYRALMILLIIGIIGLLLLNKIRLSTVSTVVLIGSLLVIIGISFYSLFNSQKKQLLFLSIFFSIVLILSFRMIGHQNPYLIHSPISLAQEIKEIENETNKRKIAVFDTRLSSLPFYLDQKIISIPQGNSKARREIIFEKNNEYRNFYWDLDNKTDMSRLIDFLKNKEGVLVAKSKEDFNDTLQFYLNKMKVKKVDSWNLYY